MFWNTAGAEVAAFTEAGHPGNNTHSQTDASPTHSQHEVIVDPQALESSASDLILQLWGSDQGIAGMHVEALQTGGVPFEVAASALKHGWRNLQERHSSMAEVRATVSCHICVQYVSWQYYRGEE